MSVRCSAPSGRPAPACPSARSVSGQARRPVDESATLTTVERRRVRWSTRSETSRRAPPRSPARSTAPSRDLRQRELGRQGHLPHQRPQVGARIHAVEGPVTQIRRRVAHRGQGGLDLVCATEDVVTVEQRLRRQRDDTIQRVDESHRAANLVAPQGVQVGDVPKEGSHQIPDEHGSVLRQPHHERVGGLTARGGVELEPRPPSSTAWLSMKPGEYGLGWELG